MNKITLKMLEKINTDKIIINYFKKHKNEMQKRLNTKDIVVYNGDELDFLQWIIVTKLITINSLTYKDSNGNWEKWIYNDQNEDIYFEDSTGFVNNINMD